MSPAAIHSVFFSLIHTSTTFIPVEHLHVLMGPAVVEALIRVQMNHAMQETNFSVARYGRKEHPIV